MYSVSNFKLPGVWLRHWFQGSYKQGTTDHPSRLQAVQPIGAWYTGWVQRGQGVQSRVHPALYPSALSLKSLSTKINKTNFGNQKFFCNFHSINFSVVVMIASAYKKKEPVSMMSKVRGSGGTLKVIFYRYNGGNRHTKQ
jgi:hypothetical protein